MTMYLSPLVDVNEIDLTTTIPAVATSIGVIVVRDTWKGPELKVQLVNNINDLIDIFGRPEEAVTNEHGQSYEDIIAAAGFLQYGTNLYCTRVLAPSATFAGLYGTMDVLGASSSSSTSSSSNSSSSSTSFSLCPLTCDEMSGCNETWWVAVTGSYFDVMTGWLSDTNGDLLLGANSWGSYSPDLLTFCVSSPLGVPDVNIRITQIGPPGDNTIVFNNVSGGTLDISALDNALASIDVQSIDGSQFSFNFELDPMPMLPS